MDAEWRSRVKELFLAARERRPEERAQYLEEVCGNDAELRRELESLLIEHDRQSGDQEAGSASTAAAEPVPDPESDPLVGSTLGRYRILRVVGKGGMGTVYEAEDPELRRKVALKVLPASLARDPNRLERFKREARSVAALSHPNAVALHSVEEEGNIHFLTMEMVHGEPLDRLIPDQGLGLGEILDRATQLAEGLRAAHEQGIIHRDLKPANVIVDTGGQLRILDFGLATTLAARPDDSQAETSLALTVQGTVLGTAPYMSPEQVEGKPLDARSDIFSLGSILYEMATGSRPFLGESLGQVMSAILRDEPTPLRQLRSDLPEGLERIVDRCLAKEPAHRYQSARELRDACAELKHAPATTRLLAAGKWVALAAALGAFVLVAILILKQGAVQPSPDTATGPIHVALNLPEGTRLSGRAQPVLALSPDGRKAAYVAEGPEGKHLYIHHLDRGEILRIEGSDGAEGPFFSPDGEWIAFGAGAISGPSPRPPELRKASLATGIGQTLCPLEDYYGGTWAEDGTIYFADELFKGLFRIDSDGGAPVPVAASGSPEARQLERLLAFPQILPGGRSLLVVSLSGPQVGELMLVDATSGVVRDLEIDAVFARYVPTGHLVYVTKDAMLSAVPFDLEREEAYGSPVALLQDLALDQSSALAISRSGSLLYATGYLRDSGRELSSLVRISAEGEIADLGFPADVFWWRFALSPDQRRLAIFTWEGSLWIYDLERGTRSKLPRGELAYRRAPVWSPDGEVLVTSATTAEGGLVDLFRQPADGSGPPERLLIEPGQQWPLSFVPESGNLLYLLTGVGKLPEVWTLPLDSPQDRQPLLAMQETGFFDGQVSPDGRWIAYVASGEGEGKNEVQLSSYPDLEAPVRVSVGGGHYPRWGPQGARLYYRGGERGSSLLVAGIGDDGTPSKGRELFDLATISWFAPTSDGTFVAIERDPESGVVTQLHLVLDWSSELTRRVPTDSPR